jgi:hypothetical protein
MDKYWEALMHRPDPRLDILTDFVDLCDDLRILRYTSSK